ncbi:glycosyltransferase family 2 protein [Scytonema sp. PCC 10023]|uniref:glycosyltransferase family 2 protein n=1 Tax=Scytonema sp. PCC 10023 TaxID=1680591 RepID=UPI0039C653BD
MNEQHLYRASIPPVPEGTQRPLWSVMIPTYNCANYLRETLASVLAQDPGPEVMQIEVVDDHSTKDDPAAVVEELGRGRVSFYQQPENVGYIRNFETCLQRSRGKLIHLLHGDDCVRESFYRKMQQLFDQHSEIGAAFCRHIFMDEHSHWQGISQLEEPKSGILSNYLERIVVHHLIQTPSIVVRRDVYEKLGGFDRRFVCCCEDWEMWVRIAANYPIGYEVEPLAAYRVMRMGSLSKNSVRSGKYAQDICRAHEIIQSYLPTYIPQAIAIQLLKQTREKSALSLLDLANEMLDVRDTASAMIQIREVFNFSHTLRVTKRIGRILLKAGICHIKKLILTFTKIHLKTQKITKI